MGDRAIRELLSALLVISAALFAIGVTIERHDTRNENRGGTPAAASGVVLVADADQGRGEGPLRAAGASGETSAERRAETGAAAGHESPIQLARERRSERIFGIDTESTVVVAIAVTVSIAFAVALWLRVGVLVPLAIVGFALAATVFDVREALHQIDESRINLTIIAAIVALLHATAAAGAVILARRQSVGGRIARANRLPSGMTTESTKPGA